MMSLDQLITALEADAQAKCVTIFRSGRAHLVTRSGTFPFENLEDLERAILTPETKTNDKEQKAKAQ